MLRRWAAPSSRAFSSLVRRELVHALRAQYAVVSPNQIQAEAVPLAMTGNDILVVAQTGAGKTLTFLLPILERLFAQTNAADDGECVSRWQPEALVVAPTPELAAQHAAVARALAACAFGAECLPSLQDRLCCADAAVVLSRFRNNSFDAARLAMVAIDEVDAVLCGGPYDDELTAQGEALLDAIRCGAGGEEPQRMLVTAHLSRAHDTAIATRFPHSMRRVQQRSRDGQGGDLVPTLRQRFYYVQPHSRDAKVLALVSAAAVDDAGGDCGAPVDGSDVQRCDEDIHGKVDGVSGGTILVFCADADRAARLHSQIVASSPALNAAVMHEALPEIERMTALSAFRSGQHRLLVCTARFARGLDFPGLRHVILYDVPTDASTYIHLAGRTARKGRIGYVSCLVTSSAQAGRYRELHALQSAPSLRFEQASTRHVS